MTKGKNKSSGQPSLFDWIKRAEQLTRQAATPAPASLYIEKEFKAALKEDLDCSVGIRGERLSRTQVADRMSELAGEQITLDMINNWTAPSHDHGMRAWLLPAFVIATGGQRRAAECISRHSGLFMLPGPEALRAEIQKIDEEISRKKSEKLKRMLFLKEIEGGNK